MALADLKGAEEAVRGMKAAGYDVVPFTVDITDPAAFVTGEIMDVNGGLSHGTDGT